MCVKVKLNSTALTVKQLFSFHLKILVIINRQNLTNSAQKKGDRAHAA